MKGAYKAVEVSAPGVLRVVERPISEPGPGRVRIRVETWSDTWNNRSTEAAYTARSAT